MVAISYGPLVDCCYDFLGTAGDNGTAHAKRAKAETRKMASDLQIPTRNLAHLNCAKYCRSKLRPFLMFPSSGRRSNASGQNGELRLLTMHNGSTARTLCCQDPHGTPMTIGTSGEHKQKPQTKHNASSQSSSPEAPSSFSAAHDTGVHSGGLKWGPGTCGGTRGWDCARTAVRRRLQWNLAQHDGPSWSAHPSHRAPSALLTTSAKTAFSLALPEHPLRHRSISDAALGAGGQGSIRRGARGGGWDPNVCAPKAA